MDLVVLRCELLWKHLGKLSIVSYTSIPHTCTHNDNRLDISKWSEWLERSSLMKGIVTAEVVIKIQVILPSWGQQERFHVWGHFDSFTVHLPSRATRKSFLCINKHHFINVLLISLNDPSTAPPCWVLWCSCITGLIGIRGAVTPDTPHWKAIPSSLYWGGFTGLHVQFHHRPHYA